jgi:hypothetical protein
MESWRIAVALFQIERLESDQGDEVAFPALMLQERGARPRTAVVLAKKVGSCWRPIVATWRLIVFSLWTGDPRDVCCRGGVVVVAEGVW